MGDVSSASAVFSKVSFKALDACTAIVSSELIMLQAEKKELAGASVEIRIIIFFSIEMLQSFLTRIATLIMNFCHFSNK
ncbi:hypothetical protein [Pelolinea submarina]|uniref:hypothetical protein n=1 Tax=Pelolinea submarina TaxID=913107 RepID=UPI000E25A8E0|nr:hypothetical protein [Pelolinea submarina]